MTAPAHLNASLSRQDKTMAAVLLAIMLAADAVRLAVAGFTQWPALIILPATLAWVWFLFFMSLRGAGRRQGVTASGVAAASRHMGLTLAVTGSVMTVAHIGLLAMVSGLLSGGAARLVLPLFMTGLSISLILMFNRMPKLIGPHAGPRWPQAWTRAIGWMGVLCGMAMIAVAWLPDMPYRGAVFVGLGMIPSAMAVGGQALRRRQT